MKKSLYWLIFITSLFLLLAGCASPTAPARSQDSAQTTTLPSDTAIILTATQAPAATSTVLPTTTPVPPSPTPTIVPVKLADLVVADLEYLAKKSLIGTDYPAGTIFGWLTNQGSLPASFIKVAFFYTLDGKKVDLGETYAWYAGAGQRVFVSKGISTAVPDGAQLGAEALSFDQTDTQLAAVNLEPRGLYTLTIPGQDAAFITGELFNPTDQSVEIWGAAALWYNAKGELVHFSTLDLISPTVGPGQAAPFRVNAFFRITGIDAGVPASDLKRYQLVFNTRPAPPVLDAITFQSVSMPFWSEAGQYMFAFGEVTNNTEKWQEVHGYWVGYNAAGQVAGLFKTSMLGSVAAPGETRPMQFILSFPGGIIPDQNWAAQITYAVMLNDHTIATDPQLDLAISETGLEPFKTAYLATVEVKNINSVDVSETTIVLRISERATGKFLMAAETRVARGNESNVIYAKPLAAGQSWPAQIYFDLPTGVGLNMVDIAYSAHGK